MNGSRVDKSNFQIKGRGSADTIAFSPNQQYLAVGRKGIEIWDLRHVKVGERYSSPMFRLSGLSAPVKAMRFVDANTLETVFDDGVVRWNLCTGERIQ